MLRIYMQKAETVMDRYSDDDRTLICRISNGDEEAMKMLVHRYWPLVFRTSLRIVCDRHEAEDISPKTYPRKYSSVSGNLQADLTETAASLHGYTESLATGLQIS